MTLLQNLIKPMSDADLVSVFKSIEYNKAQGNVAECVNDLAIKYRECLNGVGTVSTHHEDIVKAVYYELASRYVVIFEKLLCFKEEKS